MNNAAALHPSSFDMPGATASGIASGGQLVELTPAPTLGVGMTAAPHPLVLLIPEARGQIVVMSPGTPLAADEYPVLAEIWDNDEDDIFDTV